MPEPAFEARIPAPASNSTIEPEGWLQDNSRSDQERRLDPWWTTPWVNVVTFTLTLVTTTLFGYALERSFRAGHSVNDEFLGMAYQLLAAGDPRILAGLSYSVPLLLILLAHEFGHYLFCKRWHVRATLPYFGPSPTLLGTVGAFIWIRSPIYGRRSLFDIGVSGPLAGIAVALPFLFFGVTNSHVCMGAQTHTALSFGTPAFLRVVEWFRFPGVAAANICLHPMAMAAWAGLLATAVNLLPAGQLDGGHIVYALFAERGHKAFSRGLFVLLLLAGFLYWPWWIWAIALLFFRRHPLIVNTESLGRRRKVLSILAGFILLFCMSLVPVRVG
jgi:membrane-associated protease RseP (regulator of RpoE activity)